MMLLPAQAANLLESMYSSIRVIFPSLHRPTMQIQSAPRWPLCCTPCSVYWITKPPSKVLIVRSS